MPNNVKTHNEKTETKKETYEMREEIKDRQEQNLRRRRGGEWEE